jgi:hypothetical protein
MSKKPTKKQPRPDPTKIKKYEGREVIETAKDIGGTEPKRKP